MIILKEGTLVKMARRGMGEDIVFILGVSFTRTIIGYNRFLIDYSEVFGYTETSVDFEDIDYMVEIEMTEQIKNRLFEKWGEEVCKERGVLKNKEES